MAQQYGAGGGLSVSMEGPFGGGVGAGAKMTTIGLYAENWKGAASPYSQVVNVDGVSVNSMVNLQPSVEQMELFRDKELAFVAVNEDGAVTVYAVGERPDGDYTMQATILEVNA